MKQGLLALVLIGALSTTVAADCTAWVDTYCTTVVCHWWYGSEYERICDWGDGLRWYEYCKTDWRTFTSYCISYR